MQHKDQSEAKITKLNDVNRKNVAREKKKICVHGELVYTRRVGGVVLKEELDTESKYGLWRQQGGWLQRAGAF